ncbi:MAG TPA: preprotein translocase subunit SecG [Longimicrobiales bacterium]|nr:preprotein translocase subunit SecG [Longimicrobiales bacterium]
MITFLVILLLLDGLFLMGVILLQAGKGGGLAAVGGGASTDTFIGGRQAATLLTRSTWVSAAIFLGLSLVLAVVSSRGGTAPESILQREFQQGPAAAPQPLELPGTEGGFEGEEPAAVPGANPAAGQSGEGAPTQP